MRTTQQSNGSNESSDAAKHSASVKTLSLQIAVTEPDLMKAVRQAFDLAKGGGRELNLAFNVQPGTQIIPASSAFGASLPAPTRLDCRCR